MNDGIEEVLDFLDRNRANLARIAVAMRWRPDLTAGEAARVCYLPIEAVLGLREEYTRLGLVGCSF